MNWISSKFPKSLKSSLVKNSLWGVVANVLQTVFLSLFFVIMARKFVSADFAHFLIASTIYQIMVAFSSMGLGQWFIREFDQAINKADFFGKFLKIQTGLGVLFYALNIGIAFILYPNGQIRWLSIILGSNIIFDNVIYAIKNLNIAEFKQKKTFIVLIIDGFLRLLLGCLLFIYPFSILTLSVFLIILRFLTLNLFIKVGSSNNMGLKIVWQSKVVWDDLKKQILLNWQFVVIGSVSIIYWRIANIIISKMLTLQDVANYEISFRIFSILMILPTIISATIYSQFVKYYNSGNVEAQKKFYQKMLIIYTCFAILSYTFVYSFADIILPFAFGKQYNGAIICLKQMFLTMLIFPTVLLQANLIVAIKFEKIDMWLNLLSLLLNVGGCFIGLFYFRTLSVINYSVFISFLIFHICQNVFLIKKGITNFKSCIGYYFLLLIIISVYVFVAGRYNSYAVFSVFFSITAIILITGFIRDQKGNQLLPDSPKTSPI
jgi:O-antigen/teichoic acid export membrane protein